MQQQSINVKLSDKLKEHRIFPNSTPRVHRFILMRFGIVLGRNDFSSLLLRDRRKFIFSSEKFASNPSVESTTARFIHLTIFLGAGVKMEHFQATLDPRKQELLEARFLGARVSYFSRVLFLSLSFPPTLPSLSSFAFSFTFIFIFTCVLVPFPTTPRVVPHAMF